MTSGKYKRTKKNIKNLSRALNKSWKEGRCKINNSQFKKGMKKIPNSYIWTKDNFPSRKGYTKENNDSVKRQSIKVSKTLKRQYRNGRISGMLGKENKWGHHSKETKEKLSKHFTTTEITLYRKKAYKEYGYICNRCKIKDRRVLLVHHKDRNRYNNNLKNLEVLCLNCHALEHQIWRKKRNAKN